MAICPPVWSFEQLDAQRLISIESFRSHRLEEPLEQYVEQFDQAQEIIEEFLEATVDLTDLESTLVDVLTNPKLLEVFRYLVGPPISLDDLKIVAETNLARRDIRREAAIGARVRQVVLSGLDRRRFPWVIEKREPTECERNAAVTASAALMATRRLETSRRSDGKRVQEKLVHDALKSIGFQQVSTRNVSVLSDAPAPGEFCAESTLGGRKADVLVGLWDRRVMAIECKVSNSSTNSVKRLNNDAAAKAVVWKKEFGERQVVPAAVLGGVFKSHNLEDAQSRGLAIFWEHALHDLSEWVQATK